MSNEEKKSPSSPKKEKAEKVEKAEKSKDTGKLKRWIHDLKVELKKVTWPTKKQTAKHTTTVLCCVALIGVFIWVFDFLASNVIQALISLV